MKQLFCTAFITLIVAQTACKQKPSDEWIVTQRIQYDVTIKSPDPNLDWWVQNIEGMNRETYISQLLDAAYKGETKVFDPWAYKPMTAKEAAMIGRRMDTLKMMRSEPPYDLYDTILTRSFTINDITRIRFLEEWITNNKTKEIRKNVLGIAPLLQSFDDQGNLRGYTPMFWFFFDPNYPQPLQQVHSLSK